MTDRLVAKLKQGTDESIAYSITTTLWGSTPTSVEVKAYDVSGGIRTDVSSTVLTGSATVLGDVITLPELSGLTAGKGYRVEVKFTSGGNTFVPYIEIIAEY